MNPQTSRPALAHPVATRDRPPRNAAPPAVRGALAVSCGALLAAAAAAADRPPPLPSVESAVEIGTVRQNPLVLCRDGVYSTLIQGRPVWTFGDTCLAEGGVKRDTFIDNTIAWGDSLDASGGISLTHDHVDRQGVPKRFLPFTELEKAYNEKYAPMEIALWPGQLVPDPARKRVLAFYGAVKRGPDIPFEPVGAGIAVMSWDLKQVVRPPTNPDQREPTYLWGKNERHYGGGYLLEGEMLYAYAGEPKFLRTAVHVARVPLADALDRSKWRYFAGDGVWSEDPKASVSVYTGGAAGDTLFFSPYLGVYVTVFQPFLSNEVQFRVAHRPEGPWSHAGLLFTARQGSDVSYAARAHPQYAEEAGRIQYITYVMNTALFRQQLETVKVTFGR